VWQSIRATTANLMKEKILANAELVRSVAQEELDIDASYDEAGVRWLDQYIERQRDAASESTKERLPNTLGAYLGECIRQSFGGEWIEDQEGGWAVQITPRLSVFPFNKVRKQLAQAQGDSVLGLYTSIPALLRRPDAAPQASAAAASGQRPWWKLW